MQYSWFVRCHACGNILAPAREQYETLLASGVNIEEALNSLGYRRTCCRMYIRVPGQLAPGLFVEGGSGTRQISAPGAKPPPLIRGGITPAPSPAPVLFPKLGQPVAVAIPGAPGITAPALAPILPVALGGPEAEMLRRPFRAA